MKKIIIFILILCFLLIGISWLLFSPYISKTWAIKQKIQRNREELKKVVQFSKQSAEWEKKFSLFQKDIQTLLHYLPKQEDLDDLSQNLRSKAIDYSLNMYKVDFDHSFSLEKINSLETTLYLDMIPLQIRLEGQFFDIYKYLRYLEKLPCFFGFDTLEIIKKYKGAASAFSSLQANIATNVLCLSQKKKSLFGFSLPMSNTPYHPLQLSSSLITAQKNLRIRTLEKNLFIPGQKEDTDEYMVDNKITDRETGMLSLMDLNLNGIVNYQGEYMALINNQRVKKGNIIAGMEVVWITKERVCLAKDRKEIILNLNN